MDMQAPARAPATVARLRPWSLPGAQFFARERVPSSYNDNVHTA